MLKILVKGASTLFFSCKRLLPHPQTSFSYESEISPNVKLTNASRIRALFDVVKITNGKNVSKY